MNISAVNNIDTNSITSQINDMTLGKTNTTENFSDVLSSMMNSIDETNDLQNTAEEKEIQFTLGEAENTHDLLVAKTKALTALQYTVAVLKDAGTFTGDIRQNSTMVEKVQQ